MKKLFCMLLACLTLFCSLGISAAAEAPDAEARITSDVTASTFLALKAGKLVCTITVTGAASTTSVGFKNCKVYRKNAAGTYWIYEGTFSAQSYSASSHKWNEVTIPDVGAGEYHIVLTAYALRNGTEYTVTKTSNDVTL